jgi:hypothetical protein
MFHKFQVTHVTQQYFLLERTWLVYIQDGYVHEKGSINVINASAEEKYKKLKRKIHTNTFSAIFKRDKIKNIYRDIEKKRKEKRIETREPVK